MSRPKGILQARNPLKYQLPPELTLKSGQSIFYNKTTPLIFIDSDYGEYETTFHNIHRSNGSNHPSRKKAKTLATCIEKYNTTSVSAVPEIRAKATKTMEERYNVSHALQSPVFINKSKNTVYQNYGVTNGMKSAEVKEKQKNSVLNMYGVDNVMKSPKVKQKQLNTVKFIYGVNNVMQNEQVQQNWLNSTASGRSLGERQIEEYVRSFGLTAYSTFIGGDSPKQIDVFIPKKAIGIEFNGSFFHSEYNKKNRPTYRTYHYSKFKVAAKNNIELLQFTDNEWETRNFQVKSFIRAKLNQNTRVIYGRKTKIKEVGKLEAKNFLNENHILGACSFIQSFGLYLNDELLSLITIGKHHYKNNNELILSRYIIKDDVTVIGGLQKLTKHAYKIHGSLYTWIDLRFSNGNNWLKMGWKLVKQNKPDYSYWNHKTKKIVSKQSRKKKTVKTPVGMTEHEHALKDGLYRLYDCGKLKLIYEEKI